ncbi:hypothetical protein VP01_1505g4 [Puccinia sorghi]|uniref:HAT C-terminal dimerisation domain-containing protein n=1 Tax=Puccinia sorghi TaxID=27349 RepID=A0A0L6VKU0_9BASI|nr:hypothetical protein VP01_1505g4 [Puccinia sorghi]
MGPLAFSCQKRNGNLLARSWNSWNLSAKQLRCFVNPNTRLSTTLPVYIVLIQHLHSFRQGISDDQLIQPSNLIPAYFCAMILDPKFKTAFWSNEEEFIRNHYQISVDHILNVFNTEAQNFDNRLPTITKPIDSLKATSTSSDPKPKRIGIQDEINQYLSEEIETERFKVLDYWASQQKSIPNLSVMAHHYLSIPATSASSKQVFSKGLWIVSWQHSSLSQTPSNSFSVLNVGSSPLRVPFDFIFPHSNELKP